MAMTIGEASAVANLLHVLALDDRATTVLGDVDRLKADLALLNERAAKPLQLGRITYPHLLDAAAAELTQRLEDAS